MTDIASWNVKFSRKLLSYDEVFNFCENFILDFLEIFMTSREYQHFTAVRIKPHFLENW